ncbi:MAG: T9SS C-terminal target domain-containing protein [Bacteroidetes bacterium]|nr:MAG: T9SS C-terminal target domain-containing protein [Bacteroidota bacterium]
MQPTCLHEKRRQGKSIRLRPDIQDCSMATTSLERFPFQLALNISETSKEQRLVAYPNPAKDFLTFEIEVPTGAPFVVVEIGTGDGKRVLVKKYPSNEEIQTLTIPIGGLPNGLLMYKVSSGDRTLQGKFIKLN